MVFPSPAPVAVGFTEMFHHNLLAVKLTMVVSYW